MLDMHHLNHELKAEAERKVDLDIKETQAVAQLKASYSVSDYTLISGIFGVPFSMDGQFIDLQILTMGSKAEKTTDEKYADEASRLSLIQGPAGIGKTTFMRYLGYQWSKGLRHTDCTWLFTLSLGKIRLMPHSLTLSLAEWVRQSHFNDWSPETFEILWRQRIEPAIEQHKVLLILDGYDELPEKHACQNILTRLLKQRDIYRNLSMIVTSRPFHAHDISEKRTNVEILGFTEEEIQQYIKAYFLKTPDKTWSNIVIKTLQNQPSIWENAQNPLILNLLCGLVEMTIKQANTPDLSQVLKQLSSITRLYHLMEKKLYERAYAKYDTVPLKIGAQLIRAQTDFIKMYQKERVFLSKLAFDSFKVEQTSISMNMIGIALKVYVDNEVTQISEKKSQQEKENLGATFLESVFGLGFIKTVLLNNPISQIDQEYEFINLSFQEYYTALYCAQILSNTDLRLKNTIEKIILTEKYNPRWQNVWWFTAGLLKENPLVYKNYLEKLQSQSDALSLTQDIFEHQQLGLLARCVDEGFESHNQSVVEPVLEALQGNFLKHYNISKHLSNEYNVATLALIKSPVFSACRMSPSLYMNQKQDLYALFPESDGKEEKCYLLAWISAAQIVTPKVLLIVTQLLRDRDKSVRCEAASTVAKLGALAATPHILNILMESLTDEDGRISDSGTAMCRLLTEAFLPLKVDLLRRLFTHTNSDLRCYAALSIGALGIEALTPKLVEDLMTLLRDEDSEVRHVATRAISELGIREATPQLLKTLENFLRDEDIGIRSAAAETIGNLGIAFTTPQIFDDLAKMLEDKASELRSAAVKTMGKLGLTLVTPKILDTLIRLLADEAWDVSNCVVEALGKLGAAAATPPVLDALTKLLADERSQVRSSAVEAVGALGRVAATPEILERLTKLLADRDPHIRCMTARVVGILDTPMPHMLAALIRLLEDNTDVRAYAKWAMDQLLIGGKRQMLDSLIKLSTHEDWHIRYAVAEQVGKMATVSFMPQVLQVLSVLSTDENKFVCSSAKKSLDLLNPAAATPQVLDALVCSTVEANAAMGISAATPQKLKSLEALLDQKNTEIRDAVKEVRSKLEIATTMPEFLDVLAQLLRNKTWEIRYTAIKVAEELGEAAVTPQFLNQLIRMLTADDASTRQSCISVLDKLGKVAAKPEILYTLIQLLTYNDYQVRHGAVEVAAKLGAEGFKLLFSFCLENIHHTHLIGVISSSFAAAYLNTQVSFGIYLDEEAEVPGHYTQIFIDKARYYFRITQDQAQCLQRLSSLVIEQLSKIGSLNTTALQKQLPEWEAVRQASLLTKLQGSMRELENLSMHMPVHAEKSSEEKGYPVLIQYQESAQSAAKTKTNNNLDKKEVKEMCSIA